MIRTLAIACALAAGAAHADPLFEPVPDALPAPHVYDGGWEHFVGGGLAAMDCDGDGRLDLFAAGGANPAALFVNEGAMRFRAGDLPELAGVTGAYPIDLDGDVDPDLVVLRVGPNVVLRNEGGCRYAVADLGLPPGDAWTTAFSATWEAGAARPTLAFGNYVDRTDPEGPFGTCDANVLMRPVAKGWDAVPLAPGWCALSMLISDWRRTGAPELRVSNDRHYYVTGGAEEMWTLDPLRPLGEVDGWPRVSLWGMGIASRDVTGNGFPDVMSTSMGDQLLQLNDGATWRNAPHGIGTYATTPHAGADGRPSTGWHAAFGDVDLDGRADLFIAKGNVDQMPGMAMEDPNNLLMQREDGIFEEASVAAGVASAHRARGAVLADLDGDGRLDLAVVNRRAPLEVWRNVTAGAGAPLAITLRQGGGNAHAVGAWVEVRTPAGVQAQEVTVGGGHAGGVLGPLHFGLGGAQEAEVRVRWPHGGWSDWRAVAPGAVTIRR